MASINSLSSALIVLRLLQATADKRKASDLNPYDLNEVGGLNQICPKCGLKLDNRKSPYEPTGFRKYCKCNKL